MFGNPEVTAGGKALKFYASVRIDVRKSDALKDSEGAYGNHTKAKIVKNKVAPPFKTAEFDIIFGKGISKGSCLIDLGLQYEILQKSGSWFSYMGEKIAQGREKAVDYLENNEQVALEIKNKILDAFYNKSKND
jgi:recombination protein RecA